MGTIPYRLKRPMALSLTLAVAVYLVVIVWANGAEVLHRFTSLSPATVLVALTLPALGFLVRFGRWAVYMRALEHRIPWRAHLRIYVAGLALTATPGKVGENLRVLYLRPYGVPSSHGLAAFFAERLLDLVAMVLLAGLALRLAAAHSWWIAAIGGVTVVALILIRDRRVPRLLEKLGADRGWVGRSLERVAGLLRAARRLLSPRLLVAGLGLALLAWSAEAWTFGFLARSVGLHIGVPTAMGVFAVATLLGAISFVPGGVGPTEGVMIGLLVVSGASTSDAAAVTLLTRAVTLWWAVLLGVMAMTGITDPGSSTR